MRASALVIVQKNEERAGVGGRAMGGNPNAIKRKILEPHIYLFILCFKIFF